MSHFNYYNTRIFFKKTPNTKTLIPKYKLHNIDENLEKELNMLLDDCKNKKQLIDIVEIIRSRYADDFNIIIVNKYSSKAYLEISNDKNNHNLYFKYDKHEFTKEMENIDNINTQLSDRINILNKNKYNFLKNKSKLIYSLELLSLIGVSYGIYKIYSNRIDKF
jgi:hypothetical protein